MNRWIGVGRLTSKAELRYTASNIPFARFSLAINRPKREDGTREADFINVVIWRKQAENVCNYLDKGSLVVVDGRLQSNTYEDKDGNKRYSMDVIADSVQFLESKKKEEPNLYNQKNDSIDEDPFADFGEQVTIDDAFLD